MNVGSEALSAALELVEMAVKADGHMLAGEALRRSHELARVIGAETGERVMVACGTAEWQAPAWPDFMTGEVRLAGVTLGRAMPGECDRCAHSRYLALCVIDSKADAVLAVLRMMLEAWGECCAVASEVLAHGLGVMAAGEYDDASVAALFDEFDGLDLDRLTVWRETITAFAEPRGLETEWEGGRALVWGATEGAPPGAKTIVGSLAAQWTAPTCHQVQAMTAARPARVQ
jgi:hypothetical protein